MLRPSQVSAAACAWHRARTSSCVPATVQAPAVLQAPNTQPTYPLITRVYPKAHDQKVEFHASFKSQETTGDRVCLSRYSARPGSRLRRMRFCHPGRQRPVRRLQKRSDHLDFIGRARAPQAAGTPSGIGHPRPCTRLSRRQCEPVSRCSPISLSAAAAVCPAFPETARSIRLGRTTTGL